MTDAGAKDAGPNDAAPEVVLSPISVADAGEVLTIQRAAFVSEAQIYGSADMPPLTQTLEELEAELRESDGWVARIDGRLVGALRSREADGLLLIGRIAIAPDQQGAGIGRALLEAAESHSTADEAELFTGSLSEANIRLYERCGYVETERVDSGGGVQEVYLRKRLRGPTRARQRPLPPVTGSTAPDTYDASSDAR
jgi:ribosomal protein S18 acetylase RimI-like enzyme